MYILAGTGAPRRRPTCDEAPWPRWMRRLASLQPDLDGVVQAVPDEVEGDHQSDDANARRPDLPPVAGEHVVHALREATPGAPVSRRRWEAEPEEAQVGDGEDGVGDLEGGVDDDGPEDIGDDVTEDDPRPTAARGSGSTYWLVRKARVWNGPVVTARARTPRR